MADHRQHNCPIAYHLPGSEQSTTPTSKSKDVIGSIIGDIGKWQITRIILLFLISMPGISLIFSMPFVFTSTQFWCKDDLTDSVAKNLTGHTACNIGCEQYEYDRSYWTNTIKMEFDLVCEREYLVSK